MTEITTSAEQLALLPTAVQDELWATVRAGARLSQDERTVVLAAFVGVLEALVASRPPTVVGVTAFLGAVCQVLTEIDRAEFPRSEEGRR